ncbi:MAG TPA: type II toxin-antitoxin system VapC family toxin [Phycisphaerae bacterium]|nr:type II toxin-antitoxin system VapC family toxin [Phycisphaerae bacterium]
MKTLLDTNILLRSIQPSSPDHATALAAVSVLLNSGRILCISSQSIYEFLAVATRSIVDNGLGLKHIAADLELEKLLAGVEMFCDSTSVVSEARRLVVAHQVTGKKIHDGRLVAVMNVQRVSEILTFNHADFTRYPNIKVLLPKDVAQGKLPSNTSAP